VIKIDITVLIHITSANSKTEIQIKLLVLHRIRVDSSFRLYTYHGRRASEAIFGALGDREDKSDTDELEHAVREKKTRRQEEDRRAVISILSDCSCLNDTEFYAYLSPWEMRLRDGPATQNNSTGLRRIQLLACRLVERVSSVYRNC
jgi:hypothetical protein